MSKVLTAFIAAVFLAGYAVQPPEKTVPYKVTLRNGENVWDACAKVASSSLQRTERKSYKKSRQCSAGD